jgi:ATP-dependent RNA helicase DDX54/DBP10
VSALGPAYKATDRMVSSYSLRDGASFVEQARNVAFDLLGDDKIAAKRRMKVMTWDKKKKKFVQGDGTGSDNIKLVKTESGTKLPATYRSGRFDEWKAKNRTSLPRVGETENSKRINYGGKKYLHKKVAEPQQLDKLSKDYERKLRQQKKKDQSSSGNIKDSGPSQPKPGGKRHALGRRFGGKSIGRVKNELKTVDQIRKARKTSEHKRAKNARPSRKGKGKRR